MRNKLFITSTLPYSSSSHGHVGHLLEFLITDALARYNKIKYGKENVFYSTGLDEHGIKVYNKAQELNVPVKEYLEANYKGWTEFCKLFNIEYDSFYRTSSNKHHENVKKFWMECFERGDLYKKFYLGKYCAGCESIKFDKDLINGKCPDHITIEIKAIEEENWFFRFSKYKEQLLLWFDGHLNFLSPDNKRTELRNLIIELEDIPVSRLKSKLPHGVDVPNDTEQVIYIWIEALASYFLSCGHFEDEEKFNGWWENTIICCGPDNLRFQAVIFQAMLASAGLKQTGKLLVHGTVLDKDGRKMSNTDGNVIDPISQLNKFGLTAVRYYTLAGLNTFSNSSWSETELKELYNAHLANNFGNLISRTLHLIDIRNVDVNIGKGMNIEFDENVNMLVEEIKELWENFEIKMALQKTVELVSLGNKYFQENKPWEATSENYEIVLSQIYELLIFAAALYNPVIPHMHQEIQEALINKKKVNLFPRML